MVNPHRPHADRRSSLGTALVSLAVVALVVTMAGLAVGHLFEQLLSELRGVR
jgi:hypothetical protein